MPPIATMREQTSKQQCPRHSRFLITSVLVSLTMPYPDRVTELFWNVSQLTRSTPGLFPSISLKVHITVLTGHTRSAASRTSHPGGSKAWTSHGLVGRSLLLTSNLTIFSRAGNKGTDHHSVTSC